jgi:hypothetical protein
MKAHPVGNGGLVANRPPRPCAGAIKQVTHPVH